MSNLSWRDKLRLVRVKWHMFAGAGTVAAIGFCNALGGIDLKPFLALFISDDKMLGAVITAIAILFAALHAATTDEVVKLLHPDEMPKVDAGS